MGIVLLVAGCALLYLGVIDPLTAADDEAVDVTLYQKATFLVPITLVYGVAYTFFTDRAMRMLGSRIKPTRLGWVVILVLVAAGVVLFVWMRSKLESMGYRFG